MEVYYYKVITFVCEVCELYFHNIILIIVDGDI